MVICRIILGLALWLVGSAALVCQTAPKARVSIAVFDPWGRSLDSVDLQFLTEDRKGDLLKSPRSRVISNVPYGKYILRVMTPSATSERRILVNTSDMWVVGSVPFVYGDRSIEGGWLRVEGSVFPRPAGGGFVRVRGVFLDDQREAVLDASGAFAVGGLEGGMYVVEVFDGSQLVHAQTLELDIDQPVVRIKILLKTAGAK